MKLVDAIQTMVKAMATDNDKIKFEHILQKKMTSVEYLGKVLIQQEREFLAIFKQQAKFFKKQGIDKSNAKSGTQKYELASLLNESDSSDEPAASDPDDSDEEATPSSNLINFEEDWAEEDEPELS